MDVYQISALLTALLLLLVLAHLTVRRYGPGCPRCRSRNLERACGVARCRACQSRFRDKGW